jgi:Yip1 domain
MTDVTTAPVRVPGLLSRAIGIFVSPRGTFEKLLPAPRVLGAILTGLCIGLAQGLPRLTEKGLQAALDTQVQQTERFSGRAVTDEQYATMRRMAPYQTYGTIVLTPVLGGVFVVIFAGIYFVIFNVVLGGTATFKQVVAVVSHSGFITALGYIAGAAVQYVQGTASPFGPFNLGALLPMLEENTFVARLLGFINIFSIWATIVTAMGFSVLYRRKTSSIAVGLFALTLIFASVGATVMGFFSNR